MGFERTRRPWGDPGSVIILDGRPVVENVLVTDEAGRQADVSLVLLASFSRFAPMEPPSVRWTFERGGWTLSNWWPTAGQGGGSKGWLDHAVAFWPKPLPPDSGLLDLPVAGTSLTPEVRSP